MQTKSKHDKNHLARRLGHFKTNHIACSVTTVSGCDFDGTITSFDNHSFVLKPLDSDDPNALITVMVHGLESITSLTEY